MNANNKATNQNGKTHMNLLQTEFFSLRDAGMKPREALNSMIMWRMNAAATLLTAAPSVPASICELAVELNAEAERLRMTRRLSGMKP